MMTITLTHQDNLPLCDKNFITIIDDYTFIRVQGSDAANYLQGQLSCDVSNLINNQAVLGCCCNPKGRVQAVFRLFKYGEDYYLRLSSDIVEQIIARLKQYAIFSKVDISHQAQQFVTVGLAADKIITPDSAHAIIDDTHYELYIHHDKQWQALSQNYQIADKKSWKNIEIDNGFPTIYQSTYEKFLPHDLNLDQLGAIDFNKGCYTGQEIIARMHYLAKLKTRCYQLQIENAAETADIAPGTALYAPDNQETVLGHVVDVGSQMVLAVLSDKSLAQPYLTNKTIKLTIVVQSIKST
ncbi:MAG: hypothetical protein AAGA27_04415 [Pseudomonadota bacterium]